MKKSPNTPLHALEENFILSGLELENILEGSPQKIEYITKRWKLLKKEDTLSDMYQILKFSRQLEVFFSNNDKIYREMEYLLFTLQKKRWGRWYSRVIGIIAKYLQGIERFLSGLKIREIDFYNKLFEGTMIAIIEEVKNLKSSLS